MSLGNDFIFFWKLKDTLRSPWILTRSKAAGLLQLQLLSLSIVFKENWSVICYQLPMVNAYKRLVYWKQKQSTCTVGMCWKVSCLFTREIFWYFRCKYLMIVRIYFKLEFSWFFIFYLRLDIIGFMWDENSRINLIQLIFDEKTKIEINFYESRDLTKNSWMETRKEVQVNPSKFLKTRQRDEALNFFSFVFPHKVSQNIPEQPSIFFVPSICSRTTKLNLNQICKVLIYAKTWNLSPGLKNRSKLSWFHIFHQSKTSQCLGPKLGKLLALECNTDHLVWCTWWMIATVSLVIVFFIL